MRKTNPHTKFFAYDLVVEDGEAGNALWGYHIANNFTRLTLLEGTVIFPGYQYVWQPDDSPIEYAFWGANGQGNPSSQFVVAGWNSVYNYQQSVIRGPDGGNYRIDGGQSWMERYGKGNKGDLNYLDISTEKYGFSGAPVIQVAAQLPAIGNTLWYLNPSCVQTIMTGQKIRISWLYEYPGTLVYKIFGA